MSFYITEAVLAFGAGDLVVDCIKEASEFLRLYAYDSKATVRFNINGVELTMTKRDLPVDKNREYLQALKGL